MIGLRNKGRWQWIEICCQRFFCFFLVLFLFSCFYHVLYLSLSLNLKTFIPLPPYFYTPSAGRGIIMELLSFLLPLHRFSKWRAAVLETICLLTFKQNKKKKEL
jgi:hypothetical protein